MSFATVPAKMASRRLLFLMSSSEIHGHRYLQHAQDDLTAFLKLHNVKKILFVPYALFNFDNYTKRVSSVVSEWGFEVEGIHTKPDPVEAVKNAEAIYIGGGNTFLLLKRLYENNLVEAIREAVLQKGVPYIGSSAGTNVATKSIQTTNDMPIAYPPSFDALNLVPFNINPHYLDPKPNDTHRGETREQRISEFHKINDTPVLGLREGTYFHVEGDTATLKGLYNARLFIKKETPIEVEPGTDLSHLLLPID